MKKLYVAAIVAVMIINFQTTFAEESIAIREIVFQENEKSFIQKTADVFTGPFALYPISALLLISVIGMVVGVFYYDLYKKEQLEQLKPIQPKKTIVPVKQQIAVAGFDQKQENGVQKFKKIQKMEDITDLPKNPSQSTEIFRKIT